MERNHFADILKGFLSYLVVWWHCSTVIWSGYEAYYYPVKTATIAFGMPLFMAISGYFLYYSCSGEKATCGLIFDKIKRIMIPCLVWETLLTIIKKLGGGGIIWLNLVSLVLSCFKRINHYYFQIC